MLSQFFKGMQVKRKGSSCSKERNTAGIKLQRVSVYFLSAYKYRRNGEPCCFQSAVFYHFEQQGETKLSSKVNTIQKPSSHLMAEGPISK